MVKIIRLFKYCFKTKKNHAKIFKIIKYNIKLYTNCMNNDKIKLMRDNIE